MAENRLSVWYSYHFLASHVLLTLHCKPTQIEDRPKLTTSQKHVQEDAGAVDKLRRESSAVYLDQPSASAESTKMQKSQEEKLWLLSRTVPPLLCLQLWFHLSPFSSPAQSGLSRILKGEPQTCCDGLKEKLLWGSKRKCQSPGGHIHITEELTAINLSRDTPSVTALHPPVQQVHPAQWHPWLQKFHHSCCRCLSTDSFPLCAQASQKQHRGCFHPQKAGEEQLEQPQWSRWVKVRSTSAYGDAVCIQQARCAS